MTVTEINKRVAAIKAIANDDEAAHGDEDMLHQDVLRYIANQDKDGFYGGLARAALRTTKINFSRWCG